MSKYKTGDKVVIRKDLIVGKEYGENGWAEDMKYLANNDYVTLATSYKNGFDIEEIKGYRITQEMIEGLYKSPKKYVWVNKETSSDDKFTYLLRYLHGRSFVESCANKSDINKIVINGGFQDYLLTKDEAKKSTLFNLFEPIEVVEEKEYFVKLKLPNVWIRESHSYLTKGINGNNYITNLNNVKDPSTSYLFTKEEATNLVNNSNGTLIMEESK